MLSRANKRQRARRCMDGVDKSHGRDRLQLRLNKSSLHVDESWLCVTQDELKASLIEDVDALVAPKAKRKSHISKATFLSVIGAPQALEREGRVYDFDGKTGALPCTEERFAARRSKRGPKGAKSARSVKRRL